MAHRDTAPGRAGAAGRSAGMPQAGLRAASLRAT